MPDNEGNRVLLERPAPRHFRIFLSSPGDVWEERELARKLIKDKLPYRPFLRDRVTFDLVSWDDPHARTPMLGTLTPQELRQPLRAEAVRLRHRRRPLLGADGHAPSRELSQGQR